jgi:copper(I)-binding protein
VKLHRATMLALVLVAGAGVGGCKPSAGPSSQSSGSASDASDVLGPDAKPGVTAGAARLVLPVVPGRPGVIYFRIANMSKAAISLAGVHVDGVGKAEMHRTSGGAMTPVDHIDIAPGASIAFAPGGLHAMAFDIEDQLKAGGQSELTLTFADGDKTSIPVKVEAMGAGGGMARMSH